MEERKMRFGKPLQQRGRIQIEGDLHEWFFDVQTISGGAGDRSIPAISEFDRYQPTHPCSGFLQFKQLPPVRLQFQP
jgi:hypothetical protein